MFITFVRIRKSVTNSNRKRFFPVAILNFIFSQADESSDIDIFKASIEQRYPVEDYEDAPLPEHLPIVGGKFN
jgi:hypothetical protein